MGIITITALNSIVVILASATVDSFKLDITGYKHCVFNILDANNRTSQSSIDRLEQIIVSNQETQQWTITAELARLEYSFVNITIVLALQKRQRCSVNFLVQMEGTFRTYLYLVFGSRLLDHANVFILILGNRADCEGALKYQDWRKLPIIADVVRLYIKPHSSEVMFATSFCKSRPFGNQTITIPITNPTSLSQITNYSVRRLYRPIQAAILVAEVIKYPISQKGIQACLFMYRKRVATNSKILGCYPERIFLENAEQQQ